MSFQDFESISLVVLVGGLCLFMAFIIWDLAKKSKAGRFGTAILFFALFLGVAGFLAKTIIVEVLEAGAG